VLAYFIRSVSKIGWIHLISTRENFYLTYFESQNKFLFLIHQNTYFSLFDNKKASVFNDEPAFVGRQVINNER
jgi:hypothetical protein